MLLLNILLLLCASLGAVVAIGGDTWNKGKRHWLRRITKRGWAAAFCILLSFVLGLWKEWLVSEESEAAALATIVAMDRAEALQTQLLHMGATLDATKIRGDGLSSQLSEVRNELTVSEGRVQSLQSHLEAVVKLATRGIVKEVSHPYLDGQDGPVRAETGADLYVQAGDSIEYFAPDYHEEQPEDARPQPHRMGFQIGDTFFPLRFDNQQRGTLRVVGPLEGRLPVSFRNPRQEKLWMKLTVLSSREPTAEDFKNAASGNIPALQSTKRK